MAEIGNRAHPAGGARRRRGPRHVVVVALPGGGGPDLADHLRVLAAASGPAGLTAHVVVVAGDPPPPLLVGDPMSGVFWPCGQPAADDGVSSAELTRRARQLQWFLWEMGVRATVEIRRGDPLALAVEAGLDPVTDAVVLATAVGRRWRQLARRATARLAGCGVEVRAAHDRRVDRLASLVPLVSGAVR
jgi:hypothetical protein